MKVAIDSYCYHRFFGEGDPRIERPLTTRWTITEVLDDAITRGVEGISVEHFMVDADDEEVLASISSRASEAGVELAWAWGHPRGLESGWNPAALADLVQHLDIAARLGCRVMRIVCGSASTRPASWSEQRERLLPLLREAAQEAATRNVVLAVENHTDMTSTELIELIELINSPHLRVCLDTANSLRILEDPRAAARALAPMAVMAHVKDVIATEGDPATYEFWPSVPLGRGLIDIPDAVGALHEAGFTGLLALEIDRMPPGADDELSAIGESLEHLRAVRDHTLREGSADVSGRARLGDDPVLQRYSTRGLAGDLLAGSSPALLVVDLQHGFTDPTCGPGFEMTDVVRESAQLVDAAHRASVPVYFTTIGFEVGAQPAWLDKMPAMDALRIGSRWSDIDPATGIRPDDPVIVKQAASAFSGTDLLAQLQAERVDTVVICGATTSGCIRASAVDAISSGLRPFVVATAVGDRELGPHAASLTDIQAKYGEIVGLEEALELLSGSSAASPVPEPLANMTPFSTGDPDGP